MNHDLIAGRAGPPPSRPFRVRYASDAEEVGQALIHPLLEAHYALLPPWCGLVVVDYDTKPEGPDVGSAAYVRGHPEYRWATVTICPAFLSYNEVMREETIVHELVHLLLWPIHLHVHSIRGFTSDHVDAFLAEQWRQLWEAAVCDFTAAYLLAYRSRK